MYPQVMMMMICFIQSSTTRLETNTELYRATTQLKLKDTTDRSRLLKPLLPQQYWNGGLRCVALRLEAPAAAAYTQAVHLSK